ncbi:nuclear transport factor 2 family protein [Flavobacteriaceae bacterium]|nr:nuclear transport factor 2 family protein [Flavobacteriaceae bacterium]|tara:strand:- start:62681 stop:63202 length:522 start_codon:yes stop_codon:yes gene_type:complete
MKPPIFVLLFTILIVSCKESKQQDTTIETQKEVVVDTTNEKEEVLKIMKSYKDAIQNLTTEGTFQLFTQDATVFEQGKVEGTYKDYIDGHLGPELGHFKSFTFSDYQIDVNVSLPYAYTTENYLYTIVLKADEAKGTKERTIESKGVATSILKKIDGDWKIIHSHTSFKKLNQ